MMCVSDNETRVSQCHHSVWNSSVWQTIGHLFFFYWHTINVKCTTKKKNNNKDKHNYLVILWVWCKSILKLQWVAVYTDYIFGGFLCSVHYSYDLMRLKLLIQCTIRCEPKNRKSPVCCVTTIWEKASSSLWTLLFSVKKKQQQL